MKIIKQEIQFEESLKQRLEFICEFSKVNPTFIKGSIRKIYNLLKIDISENCDIMSYVNIWAYRDDYIWFIKNCI